MGIISTPSYRDAYEKACAQSMEFMGAWRQSIDEIDKLMAMLKDANELLRSTNAIAERRGAESNWPAFQKRVQAALAEQHKVLRSYYDADESQQHTPQS